MVTGNKGMTSGSAKLQGLASGSLSPSGHSWGQSWQPARRAVGFARQPHPKANPTCGSGRIAHNQLVWFNRLGDHRSGGDQAVFAKLDAADNRGVRADRGASADESFSQLPVASGTRVPVVSKYRSRTHERLVFQKHAGIDRDIVLNFDTISNGHIVVNEYIRTDLDILANYGVRSDVYILPNEFRHQWRHVLYLALGWTVPPDDTRAAYQALA